MSDFWKDLDHSYRLFSQFCNSDDWHKIIKVISGAIIKEASHPDCQVSILDVGCGTGASTETICEQIFSRTRCFPSLSIVEPSQIARDRVNAQILPRSALGPLHYSIASVDELPGDYIADAILFLHSTYYIEDFDNVLQYLIDTHLRPGGAVFALVLPEQSPFFLNMPPLPNCADSVEALFRKSGLKDSSFTLRSRFHLPDGDGFNTAELDSLRKFWCPILPSAEAFGNRLKTFVDSTNEIDFQDNLICGKKKQ